ncbi:class F sortase [Pseudokineococcus basanitobsidens]|uniref:Class F sortase n=1 Tax=Pseudokineococcus basanitobsidens TaxID=1926649 RepID=A0ABU8RHM5_9ACTN
MSTDSTPPTGGASPSRGRRRPSRRAAALATAAVLAVGGAVLVAAGLGDAEPVVASAPVPAPTAPPPSPRPTLAPSPSPSPSPTTSPAVVTPQPEPEAQPTAVPSLEADADTRLRVPSVGLDLPVHELRPDDGAINPPTMTDAYWIAPYGEPGAGDDAPDNTVYVAAHSWSRGDAAFDPLLDADFEGGAVEPGDEVVLDTPSGEVDYAVTDVRRYGKDALPDADAVWQVHPGRLVLITCFQREDGRRSTENLVVTAEQTGPAAG